MKTYFLLRDNQENGPYSFEDLKKFTLKPYDLIWIEGQSTGWQYPTEITELKEFVCTKKDVKNIPVYTKDQSKQGHGKQRVFVALPSHYNELSATSDRKKYISDDTGLETKFSQPLAELKERYSEHLTQKKVFHKKVYRPNGFWLVGLVGGLIVCAVFIKKIVEGFGDENVYEGVTSEASVFEMPEQIMSSSSTIAYQEQATEAVVIDTVAKAKPKKFNLMKMVKLSSNDYRVGVFGGINNLKLKLANSSPVTVDRVVVQVEFLKPNGDVINTEIIEVNSISAHSSKTIDVPPSQRGVKVKYKITGVSSRQHKATLMEV